MIRTGMTTFAALMLTATMAMAQVKDMMGIPGPITVGDTSYALAWSAQPQPHYTKQEYLPAGQTLPMYQQMLLVERVDGVAVMDAVKAQVEMLNKRKGSDPLVNMDVIENKASGEALLDFIVSSKDTNGEFIVEWNAYRYAPFKGNSNGVLLFGVSHRAYGNDNAKAFLTNLKALRGTTIQALTQASVPEPKQ